MLINKMLEELYNSNWLFKQCLFVTKNINSAEFLMSEISYKILTCSDSKFEGLYLRNEYKAYIITMIKNEWISKYSTTFINYRLNDISIDDYIDQHYCGDMLKLTNINNV